jgi:hypothetical protein
MPLATPRQYAAMLDAAADRGYAYAAINVTSSETLNAALRGFRLANADGIVQLSVGAAAYLSGAAVQDALLGARAFARSAQEIAAASPVLVALHTDHCPPSHLDDWLLPLLAESKRRVGHGAGNCCGPGVESCGLRCRELSGVKRGTRELAAGTVLGSNYAPGVADADRADDAAEDHESTRHADAEAERRERGLVGCGNDRRRLAAWYPGDEEPAERQALHLRDGGSSGCGQRLVGEIAIERRVELRRDQRADGDRRDQAGDARDGVVRARATAVNPPRR